MPLTSRRPSGVLRDIAIAAGIAITQVLLTWYGIHVSVEKKRVRNAIIVGLLGGIGIGLTIWGTIRSGKAQQSLQAQLNTIQHNTEKPQPPPVVNVLPPTPTPRHTAIAWDLINAEPQPRPILPFTTGQAVEINMGFINAGEFAVISTKERAAVLVVPFDNELSNAYRAHIREILRTQPRSGGTLLPHQPIHTYFTFTGPKLSDQDVADLNSGVKMLCGIGAVTWNDSTGTYRTTFNQCCIHEPNDAFNWHSGVEVNHEEKIK